MVDVAADLRAALVRAMGPLDPSTLRHGISDARGMQALREEIGSRLHRYPQDGDQSRLLGTRSVILRILGDLDSAEADASGALKHAEVVGTDLLLAPARARLAQILRLRDRLEEADRLYALAEAGELPRPLIGNVRAYAALSCIVQDRLTEALIHLQRAMENSPYPIITNVVEIALDLVYERAAPKGFGPPPRSWEQRAQYPAPRRFQDPRTGRWGYLGPDRRPVIPASYSLAGDFRGGIAAVCNADWGAIDTTGHVVVPLMYNSLTTPLPDGRTVDGFVNGVAVADRRGAKGVISRSGRMIVAPRFRMIIVHPAGYAFTGNGAAWGALDHHGDELVAERFDRSEVLRRLDGFITVDDGPL